MKLRPTFRLSTLLVGIALVAVSLTSWRKYEERKWNRSIDPFAEFVIKRHRPTTEANILVKLLRRNPFHTLWQEHEFESIFQSDTSYWLSQQIAWPHQTIELDNEQVHILRAADICNRRLIFVHVNKASQILDVKIVDGQIFFASHAFSVKTIFPQPVIQITSNDLNDSRAPPVIQELAFTKSTAKKIDQLRVKIVDHRD